MKFAPHIPAISLPIILTACAASSEDVAVTPDESAAALDFAAYVTRYSRDAAAANDITDVKALVEAGGFGVFGYNHGLRKFDDYVFDITVPTFLVNQNVWFKKDKPPIVDADGDVIPDDEDDELPDDDDELKGCWTYEPVKYYDNNVDARHSFFAYAPYNAEVDMVFASGKAPQLRYDIQQDIDLLWAKPTKDLRKPDVEKPVTFNFSHALTKTIFHVAPFVDEVHGDGGHATDDPATPEKPDAPISIPLPAGTTVQVRSIHINGAIPYVGLLNTEDGEWTTGTTADYFNVPNANEASWTGDGTTIQKYHLVQPSNKLIPTRNIAIEVIYDVISEEGGHTTHVTRKAISQETFDLVRGKAYNIYLDLGLNSVKFLATTSDDWTPEDHNIDLPEVETEPILIETVLSTILHWQAGVSDETSW